MATYTLLHNHDASIRKPGSGSQIQESDILTMLQDIPDRMFFDMDGVLVDLPRDPGIVYRDKSYHWWCELGQTALFNKLAEHKDLLKVVSWPCNHLCYKGKCTWLQGRGIDHHSQAVFTKSKWLLSGPGRVLVDDYDFNCQQWAAYGGVAIWVQP